MADKVADRIEVQYTIPTIEFFCLILPDKEEDVGILDNKDPLEDWVALITDEQLILPCVLPMANRFPTK